MTHPSTQNRFKMGVKDSRKWRWMGVSRGGCSVGERKQNFTAVVWGAMVSSAYNFLEVRAAKDI